MPGITVRPETSTTRSSAVTSAGAAAPTATMRSPSIVIVRSACEGLSPSSSEAWVRIVRPMTASRVGVSGLTGFLRTPGPSLTRPADDVAMKLEIPGQPSRRQLLALLGGASGLGLLALAGCGNGTDSASPSGGATSSGLATTSTTGATTATAAASNATVTSAVPEETAGPYPGDGSNGPDYLGMNGAVRSDIRSSLGSSAAVTGVPLTIRLTVLDLKSSAKALTNAGVYVWHCNQAGQYSMYSQGATNETFCRGIQPTDSSGTATFTSVWPG